MAGGRPLKFKSVEEMQAKIDSYFKACDDDNPPLISGLAYHLDINTESLRRYGEDEQF